MWWYNYSLLNYWIISPQIKITYYNSLCFTTLYFLVHVTCIFSDFITLWALRSTRTRKCINRAHLTTKTKSTACYSKQGATKQLNFILCSPRPLQPWDPSCVFYSNYSSYIYVQFSKNLPSLSFLVIVKPWVTWSALWCVRHTW